MKVYVNDLRIANLSDINDIQSKTIGISHDPSIRRENWFDLWTKKVDYLEYQMSQFSKRFPILIDSISYFVGLAENAISYIKNTSIDVKATPLDEFVVSHRRIEKDATLYDIYNPLNLIVDHKVRDLSEYIKVNIFNDKNIWEEIHLYFKFNVFSPYGIRLLYGRLLYPTIYFDTFEDIIDRKCEEETIVPIIKKISDYEEFLSDIFHYLNLIAPLPKIEWLIKK
jgi:spore coat protein YutH